MVSVRSHLRRLRSGKIVRVRAHKRRGPAAAAPAPTASSDAGGFGFIWLVLAALIVIGLLSGGIATYANSSQVASETNKTSRSATPRPSSLPPGPEGRLAGQLRDARENAGLSQKEVSVRTGIGQSTINDFERALAVPSAESMQELSSVYELSLDEWTALVVTRSEIR
ncbi:helix-turn-helix domain-containing protein [Nonomuraea candida]|uniref:helix-turn-helix domain-containing protein n=1 Tax=Nonomuraea candida TaxID=359159 RepID=UPI000A000056|nr:helix-turn-helix transcriptional regulator [Nonomuraea candida]